MRRGHLQASSLSSSPSEESRRDGSTLARAFSCLYFGRFHIIWHIYGRSHRSAWRVFCILFGSPYKYLRSVADPSSQGPEVIGVPLQSFWRSAIYPASLAWILLFCFASLWLDSARSSFFFVKISFFGNRSTFISVMTRCVALIISNSFLTLSRSFRSPSLLRRAMSRLLLSFANIDFGMSFSLRAIFSSVSSSASLYLRRRYPKIAFACRWSILINQFKLMVKYQLPLVWYFTPSPISSMMELLPNRWSSVSPQLRAWIQIRMVFVAKVWIVREAVKYLLLYVRLE